MLDKLMFWRKPVPAKKTMPDEDKRIIEAFAQGDESARLEAIRAFRRNIHTVGVRGNDHQRFMAEVDTPVPDLALRQRYRQIVCDRAKLDEPTA